MIIVDLDAVAINIMLVVGDEGDDLPDGFVCSLKTDAQYRALIYAFMDLC